MPQETTQNPQFSQNLPVGGSPTSDLMNRINSAQLPQSLKDKSIQMIQRLEKLVIGGNLSEYESIEHYINWITQIPFGQYTQDSLDLINTRKSLDSNHYGLNEVKDKILEFLAVFKLKSQNAIATSQNSSGDISQQMQTLKGSSANPPILLFIGIQGIGKTSMAKSIADALGRKFLRVSLAGMSSVNDMKGINRAGSVNAEPGRIIKALVDTGVMNPVILLDELDKVSDTGNTRLDIMSALLEVLDPEQNSAYVDRYIDYPIDISKCIFIATANNIGGITSALLDRMEVVRFTSYSDEDKVQIAKNYLLKKVRQATGLNEQQLSFDDSVWPLIVRPLGFDAGIRELERTLTKVANKVAKKIVEGEGTSYTINPQNFREYIPDDFGIFA